MASIDVVTKAMDASAAVALKEEEVALGSEDRTTASGAVVRVTAKMVKAGFGVTAKELAAISQKVESIPTKSDMEAMLVRHAAAFTTVMSPTQVGG